MAILMFSCETKHDPGEIKKKKKPTQSLTFCKEIEPQTITIATLIFCLLFVLFVNLKTKIKFTAKPSRLTLVKLLEKI